MSTILTYDSQQDYEDQLKETLDSISVSVHALIEEKDDFAQIVNLQASKNQILFSTDILKHEIFKLNQTFKRKIGLKDGLFFYKDVIELEILGKGAFGTVYKVFDPNKKQFFAKKVMISHSQLSFNTLALGEILPIYYISQVDHPSFLSIYRVEYVHNSRLEILMEYGIGTLEDFIRFVEEKKLIYENFGIDFFIELMKKLEILHDSKLCHRDIKPSNIIISSDYQLKFSDFGCSAKFNKRGPQWVNVVGTPAYMSDKLKEAYETKNQAFVCPYEEDLYALRISMDEIIQRTKGLELKATKSDLFREFELLHFTESFKKIKDIKVRLKIVLNLECIYKDNISFEGSSIPTEDVLSIKFVILTYYQNADLAYKEKRFKMALNLYEKMIELLIKFKVQYLKGRAFFRVALTYMQVRNFEDCLKYLQLEKNFLGEKSLEKPRILGLMNVVYFCLDIPIDELKHIKLSVKKKKK